MSRGSVSAWAGRGQATNRSAGHRRRAVQRRRIRRRHVRPRGAIMCHARPGGISMRQVIDGRLIDGSGGEADAVLNPATEETIAVVPRCDAEDVDAARRGRQRAALPEWLTTPGERAAALLALAGVLEENAEELATDRVGQRRQAACLRARGAADHGRPHALLRRRRPGARGQEHRRVRARLHLDAPARAARGRRPGSHPGTTR